MHTPWPEYVSEGFQVLPTQIEETNCCGGYNKLLNHLFQPHSEFTITPHALPSAVSSNNGSDISFEVTIANNLPVFVLQYRSPRSLEFISTRAAVDSEIRTRMGDLAETCPIPRLHGVCAIGRSICFYHLSTEHVAPEIIPLAIARHPTKTTDTAPVAQWDCEVVSAEGEKRIQKVVDEIVAMTG